MNLPLFCASALYDFIRMRTNCTNLKAVSYTHLDVYKRQVLSARSIAAPNRANQNGSERNIVR